MGTQALLYRRHVLEIPWQGVPLTPLFPACRGQAVALDTARGLAYLHQCNVLHLDIKSGEPSATVRFWQRGQG